MSSKNNDRLVALQAILVNFLWGTPIVLIKKSYEAFGITDTAGQLLFAGLRFTLAGLALLIIGTIRGGKIPVVRKENRSAVLVAGLVQIALCYFFEYIGLGYTSGTNGTLINSFSPFAVLLFSLLFFRNEHITPRQTAALVLSFCGILIALLEPGKGLTVSLRGEGFVFFSVISFCLGSILSKRVARRDSFYAITTWVLFIGGIVLVLIGLVAGGSLSAPSLKGLLTLFYLTFIAGFCVLLWSKLLAENPANKVCIYQFVNPLTGVICSAILLGENIFRMKYIVSLLLVCGGIVLVNMKTPRDTNQGESVKRRNG